MDDREEGLRLVREMIPARGVGLDPAVAGPGGARAGPTSLTMEESR